MYSDVNPPTKPSKALHEREAAQIAELFRALADSSRVRILSTLLANEQSVGEIVAAAHMSQSAVSHQLRGLRQMRLVRAAKRGREVYYALDDAHVADLFRIGLEHVSHG